MSNLLKVENNRNPPDTLLKNNAITNIKDKAGNILFNNPVSL